MKMSVAVGTLVSCIRDGWMDIDWTGHGIDARLYWIGLDWIGLHRTELYGIREHWHGCYLDGLLI